MNERTKRILKRLFVGELSWRRLAKSIAFIYGSLLVFAIFVSDSLLFVPHAASYAAGPPYLTLETQSGVPPRPGGPKIAARLWEQPNAKYVVLFSHGNAEDLGDIAPLAEMIRDALGASVFAYDYDGYGQSEGKPSERRLYADIDAAYAYLTETQKVPPSRIIAYGRSLGGGPAVDLASRRPLAGLVLESTFMSAYRVVTRWPIFPWDKFENLAKMSRVACPVLVMHGQKDGLIPIRHGEALYAAATRQKRALWVPEAEHADVPIAAGEAYPQALREFLRVVDYANDASPR